MKKIKKIPKFKNEDQEREFWANHDATDYFDMSRAIKNPILPNLRPSTQAISLRLPKFLLARVKQVAKAKDVPYQSLMKVYLSDKVNEEMGKMVNK